MDSWTGKTLNGKRSGPFVSFVPLFVSFVMNPRLSGPLPSL